jgi:hypothetical protein
MWFAFWYSPSEPANKTFFLKTSVGSPFRSVLVSTNDFQRRYFLENPTTGETIMWPESIMHCSYPEWGQAGISPLIAE